MEIELIKRIPKRQLSAGSAAMYYEASERRVLKLARKGTAEELRSQLVGYVKSLMKANPEHQIRIRWRDPDGRDTANEVTKVDPVDRPERLLERALTRTVHLNGFRGLPDATSEVIPRLANRMLEAIRSTIQEDRRRK